MIDSHSNYLSQEDRITDQLNSPQIIDQVYSYAYGKGQTQVNDKQKEQFFEALGLPADLSQESMKQFAYNPGQSNLSANNLSAMPPNYLESPFMDHRSGPVYPSTQQQYKSMFANNFNQNHKENVSKQLQSVQDNSAELSGVLNNSSLLNHSQKDTYQTAQFKPGFGNFTGTGGNTMQSDENEILTITIEIGPNQNETIPIKNGDNPMKLAKEFCKRHGISGELEQLLAEQIRLNIDQVRQNEAQKKQDTLKYLEEEQVKMLRHRNTLTGTTSSMNNLQNPNMDLREAKQDIQFEKPPLAQSNKPSSFNNTGQSNTNFQQTNQQTLMSGNLSDHHKFFYDEKMDEMSSVPNSNSAVNTRPTHSKKISNHYEPTNFRTIQPNQFMEPGYGMTINSNDYTQEAQSNNMKSSSQVIDKTNSQESAKGLMTQQGYNDLLLNNDIPSIAMMDPQSTQYKNWFMGVSNNLSSIGSGNMTTHMTRQVQSTTSMNHKTVQNSGRKPPLQPNMTNALRPSGHDQLKDRPTISENSHMIMHQKRLGNTLSSTGQETTHANTTVHNRLFQQAVARQRVNRNSQRDNHSSMVSQSNVSYSMARPTRAQSFDNRNKIKRCNSVSNIVEKRRNNRVQSLNSTSKLSPRNGSYNYGHKLYEQGVKRKEEQQFAIQRARSEQDRAEMEQLSFQPQINPVSRKMKRINGSRAEDNLINYGKAIREKREEQRVQNLKKEVDSLNFHPTVCKTSSEIVKQKRSNSNPVLVPGSANSKFESLYQDACRRQERQNIIYSNCVEAECTFQPDIDKTRYYNIKNQSLNSSRANEVFDRLSQRMNNSYDRSKLMMQHSKNLTNELFDPETGQEYFKPKVGRGPRGTNYKPGKDLYNAACHSREKKDTMRRMQHQMSKTEAQKQHSKKLTNKIVANNKIKSFQQIFEELDSDGDGIISSYRINITTLEPDLLQVLSPLFIEMEELGMTLNLDEFIDAADRLYKAVSLPEKNLLVQKKNRSNSARSRTKNYDSTFRPHINPVSRKLANQKEAEGDVSKRLYNKHNEYLLKRQQKKYESEDKELLGCTFKPNLSLTNKSSVMTDGMQMTNYTKVDTTLMNTKETYDMTNIMGLGYNHNQIFPENQFLASKQIKDMAHQMTQNLLNTNHMKTPGEKEYLVPLQYPMGSTADSNKFTFQNSQNVDVNNTLNLSSGANQSSMFNPRYQTSVNMTAEPSQITVGNIPTGPSLNLSMNQFLGANPSLQYGNVKNHISSGQSKNTQNVSTAKNSQNQPSSLVQMSHALNSSEMIDNLPTQMNTNETQPSQLNHIHMMKQAAMGLMPSHQANGHEYGAMPFNEYKRNQVNGGILSMQNINVKTNI